MSATKKVRTHKKLTPKILRFCEEYLKDLNGSAAVRRAGYATSHPSNIASQLMARPHVVAEINRQIDARSERVRIEQDEVLRDLVSVLRADASSIVEYRRTCCRYCYGEGHRYQRTAGEMARDRRQHVRLEREAEKAGDPPLEPFDEQGGIGWDPRREPTDDCPECFGEGNGEMHLKDTRTLVGGDRRLFDGVRQTKEGIEVKVRDRTKVAELIGRHLGMFNDRLELNRPRVRIKDFTGRKAKTDQDDE